MNLEHVDYKLKKYNAKHRENPNILYKNKLSMYENLRSKITNQFGGDLNEMIIKGVLPSITYKKCLQNVDVRSDDFKTYFEPGNYTRRYLNLKSNMDVLSYMQINKIITDYNNFIIYMCNINQISNMLHYISNSSERDAKFVDTDGNNVTECIFFKRDSNKLMKTIYIFVNGNTQLWNQHVKLTEYYKKLNESQCDVLGFNFKCIKGGDITQTLTYQDLINDVINVDIIRIVFGVDSD